ncbi:IclR family transcriptional regulator [Calderihabitans maritimus]|uniref:Glycerol operon regulatory protein n=1 Tax=Calderihabitans maritimus TaxID=1246530 RepID=A0A1Z5HWW8_9FIRM|nr:IclR family transcriptional regulator [Calderihabitans maritimus]GAW93780.1 pectin degradation repressor protein KdgR [Calderihabitans maritimus]
MSEDERYTIRSIDRAIDILFCFTKDGSEFSITELAKLLKLHKSTVHRLVITMASRGLLERNPQNGKYRLGLKILELGSLVADRMDLRQRAREFLEELSARYRETVHLVVRDQNEAIYIDKVEPPDAVVRYSRVGKRLPLYCTAVGKVLLAGLPPERVVEIVDTLDLNPLTERTITSRERLVEEVELVRRQGYALDNEELEPGLRCVAAPIWDHRGRVIAACSISGSASRINNQRMEKLIKAVKRTALAISQHMGYTGRG